MTRSRILVLLSLTAPAIAACPASGPPIDPNGVTQQAALRAEQVIHQAGLGLGFTNASDGTLKRAMGATTATTNSTTTMMAPFAASMPPAAMMRALVGPSVTAALTGTAMPTMLTPEEQFDQRGKEVRRLMQERLFVDSNLESKTNDAATYLLHPDPTCRPLTADTDPPGTVPPIGAKCQDDLMKVEVRIEVKADGDGARFTLLIGPQRFELAAFIIHSDEVALEEDLPGAKAAADYMQQQLGNGSPTGSYDRLAGRMRVSLRKVSDGKVTVALAIIEGLDVAPTGGSAITSAATDPLVAVTGDGNSKTALLQWGLGQTEISGTWDPKKTGASNRDQHLSIGGVYGKATLDDTAKQITMTDVGIGETKLTVRGAIIFDVNLNADTMRRYSGTATVTADDNLHVDLTPKFDLTIGYDYSSVAVDYVTPPDPLRETYGVALLGSGSAATIETVKSTTTFGGGIKVIAGTLTLSAQSVPAQSVSVPAGKCLVSQSPAPAGSNPILGRFAVSDCP